MLCVMSTLYFVVFMIFIARQSLPIRGNWDKDSKCEENSNFYQLLKLRCGADFEIEDWLKRKQRKYTSPDIQNEMIKVRIPKCFL